MCATGRLSDNPSPSLYRRATAHADRRRLRTAQAKLEHRLEWAAEAKQAASDRLDALEAELATVTAELDALEAER